MVNIHAAKTNLSALLEQCEQGKEVIIARAGKPIAQLVPYQAASQSRQLGKLQLTVSIEQLISEWQNFGIKLLPLLPAHSQAFSTISLPHKDPFDKLLLASAAAGPMY